MATFLVNAAHLSWPPPSLARRRYPRPAGAARTATQSLAPGASASRRKTFATSTKTHKPSHNCQPLQQPWALLIPTACIHCHCHATTTGSHVVLVLCRQAAGA